MPSKQSVLSMQSIASGDLLAQANEALADLSRDVIMRPSIERPRKLTIVIEITPNTSEGAARNMPSIECKITPSLPGTKCNTGAGIVRDGRIYVNEFPREPLQGSLLIDGLGDGDVEVEIERSGGSMAESEDKQNE